MKDTILIIFISVLIALLSIFLVAMGYKVFMLGVYFGLFILPVIYVLILYRVEG